MKMVNDEELQSIEDAGREALADTVTIAGVMCPPDVMLALVAEVRAGRALGKLGKLDLDRLHALHSTATAAPWKADATQPDDVVIWGPRVDGDDRLLMNVAGANPSQVGVAFDIDKVNAELMVEMRNGLSALLALARRTSSPDLLEWTVRLAQILSVKENGAAFWHARKDDVVKALRRVGPPPEGPKPPIAVHGHEDLARARAAIAHELAEDRGCVDRPADVLWAAEVFRDAFDAGGEHTRRRLPIAFTCGDCIHCGDAPSDPTEARVCEHDDSDRVSGGSPVIHPDHRPAWCPMWAALETAR